MHAAQFGRPGGTDQPEYCAESEQADHGQAAQAEPTLNLVVIVNTEHGSDLPHQNEGAMVKIAPYRPVSDFGRDQSPSYSRIAAMNVGPQVSSFTLPTPGMSANSTREVGWWVAIALRLASLKT